MEDRARTTTAQARSAFVLIAIFSQRLVILALIIVRVRRQAYSHPLQRVLGLTAGAL